MLALKTWEVPGSVEVQKLTAVSLPLSPYSLVPTSAKNSSHNCSTRHGGRGDNQDPAILKGSKPVGSDSAMHTLLASSVPFTGT